MARGPGNDDFVPEIVEEKDDEYTFELRNKVFVAVRFASEKKLRFQMWREMVMLPADEGNIFTQSFRDRLVAQARDGFNEAGKPDRIPHIADDIGKLATVLGHRGDGGKSMQERLAEQEGASITERLITVAEEGAKLFRTQNRYRTPSAKHLITRRSCWWRAASSRRGCAGSTGARNARGWKRSHALSGRGCSK